MDNLKQYCLSFSGLGLGLHQYHFDIDLKFFDNFEQDVILFSDVKIDISLEKQERMLIYDFFISGFIKVECDRCLEEMIMPIEGNERLIVKFGEEKIEESEDVLILTENEHKIDISGYIYDYIMVRIPIKKVHNDDENGISECNPKMLEILDKLSERKIDNRFDKLKDLFNNN